MDGPEALGGLGGVGWSVAPFQGLGNCLGFSWGVAPGYHILARWAVRECLRWF